MMEWAAIGTDSAGRDIGYSVEAECDHPGCDKRIDRGLAYACGGMHGGDEYFCERYFCYAHLWYTDTPRGHAVQLCWPCREAVFASYNHTTF